MHNDNPLTPKQQEYADMIKDIDPFNMDHGGNQSGKSSLDAHIEYMVHCFENGDSLAEVCEVLDISREHMKQYLRKKMGQNWFDHNVECRQRSRIMRATYRQPIMELRAKGKSHTVIARILGLTKGKVASWCIFYRDNVE